MLETLDNPLVTEFLIEYYGKIAKAARELSIKITGSAILYGELFDKLSTPVYYLQEPFEAWKKERGAKRG